MPDLDREQRLRDYTAAVARLREDPDTWAAYQRERQELDGTAWAQERIAALEAELARERQELADCTRDGQRLSRLLAEEEETTEALEKALHALVAVEPVVYRGQGVAICGVCRARETFHEWRDGDGNAFPHKADCPWVAARALLKS